MRKCFALLCMLLLCLGLMGGSAFANQLTNPGFESGITAEWNMNTWGGASQLVADAAKAHSGTNCMHFDAGGAAAWIGLRQLNVPGTAGKYYRFRAWFQVPSAAVTPVNWTFRVNRGVGGEDLYTTTINTSEWTEVISNWYKLPSGQALWSYVGGYLSEATATPEYYTDDWSVDEAAPYSVSGRVVDTSGNPVKDAKVYLDTSENPTYTTTPLGSAITDVNGNYTIAIPPVETPTTYYVDATHLVYEQYSGPQSVVVPPSPATAQDIVLNALPLVNVHGKLTYSGTTDPVVDATVGVSMASGTGLDASSLTTVTDSQGNYTIQLVAGQLYYLSVRKFGIVPADGVREWEVWTMDDAGLPKNNEINIEMVEDQPLVKVDADPLAAGPMTSWTNTGSLGGAFELVGATGPVATSQSIYKSVLFDNNPMVLVKDGARVLAPASITGTSGAYTVSAWLYDTVMPDQQTYIAWAKRGGPDGTNCEMVYGTNTTWGAAGHWGGPDLSWGSAVSPSGGAWHHVCITWDGSVERAYIDGVEANNETKQLNIPPDLPIVLGAGYDYDADPASENYQTITPSVAFGGHMARVEIYANVANAEDVVSLMDNGPATLDVSTIKGKVVTADGSEPSGFTITVKTDTGDIAGVATTPADGTYKVLVAAPGSFVVSANKAGFVTTPAPQAVTFASAGQTANLTDFVAAVASISGVVKDAVTGQPIYNACVQVSGKGGPAVVTNEDGAYSFTAAGGCGGVEIFADAMGYHCANLVVTGTGSVVKTILLNPEEETGVLRNGEMENPFTDEWVKAVSESATFKQSTDARHGQYSLWYTNQTSDYGGIRQDVQLTPGYVYNFYMRAKADAGLGAWQPMFEFSDADGNNWNGFVSAEPEYTEWYHAPPRQWYTYLKWFDRAGSHNGPAIRVAAPDGATQCYWICLIPAQTPMPDANSGAYIDSVVVDKVAINEPLVVVPPDGGVVKPYGANNKSVLTDDKLVGKTVKAWGKVVSVNGTTSFVMTDGYSAEVTVKISGVSLPSGFAADKMAVVTGVVNADKSIQASQVAAF